MQDEKMSTQNKNIFSPMTFLQVWDTMVRVYLKWEKIIKTKEEENMENKKAFGHALAIFTIFIQYNTTVGHTGIARLCLAQ